MRNLLVAFDLYSTLKYLNYKSISKGEHWCFEVSIISSRFFSGNYLLSFYSLKKMKKFMELSVDESVHDISYISDVA